MGVHHIMNNLGFGRISLCKQSFEALDAFTGASKISICQVARIFIHKGIMQHISAFVIAFYAAARKVYFQWLQSMEKCCEVLI